MSISKNLYFRIKRKFKNSNYKQIQCERCGCMWSPIVRIGGRLPNKWWICPICRNGEE